MWVTRSCKTESSILQEQQSLIVSLIQIKTAREIQVKALSDIINSSNSVMEGTRDPDGYLLSCSTNDSSSSSAILSDEMWIYCGLIRGILSKVDGCRSGLAKRRYARMRKFGKRMCMNKLTLMKRYMAKSNMCLVIFPYQTLIQQVFALHINWMRRETKLRRISYRRSVGRAMERYVFFFFP